MILHLPRRLPLSSRAPIRDPPDRGEPTRAVTHRPRTTGIRAELRPHDTPTLLSRTDFSPLILARVFPLRLNTDQSRRPTASTTARTPLTPFTLPDTRTAPLAVGKSTALSPF